MAFDDVGRTVFRLKLTGKCITELLRRALTKRLRVVGRSGLGLETVRITLVFCGTAGVKAERLPTELDWFQLS